MASPFSFPSKDKDSSLRTKRISHKIIFILKYVRFLLELHIPGCLYLRMIQIGNTKRFQKMLTQRADLDAER